MKYPKQHGPQTDFEQLSMLHGQLASAYSIIAQYEADERQRESDRIRDAMLRPTERPKREVPDDEGAWPCVD